MSRDQGLGMGRFQRLLFLRTMPALQNLEPEVAAVIADTTVEKYFERGEMLHHQGTPTMDIHYVVRGLVEIRRHGRPVRTLGPRTVVGGVSALAEDEEGYDCVALENTVTLQANIEDGQEIFEDHFALLRGVLKGSSAELLDARRQLGLTAGFAEPEEDFDLPDGPLDLVDRMAILRKSLSFAEGKIDAIADLAEDTTEHHYPAGTVLWDVGEVTDYLLLPLKGVVRGEAENPKQVFRLGAGASVGGLDAIAEQPRWFKAVVERDLVAFRVEVDSFFDVLEDNFDMSMALLRTIAQGRMKLYDLQAEMAEATAAAGKPAA